MGTAEVICGRAGCLWTALLQGIAESRTAGKECILLVPEQYTLQAEKDLITDLKLKGLIDIDVLSPQRLQTRVREYAGSTGKRPLNERGRGLAMSRALLEQEDKLEYYGSTARLQGTARELCVTLSELQEAGLQPEKLAEIREKSGKSGEKAKLADLEKLWNTYDRIVAPGFEDESARQAELLKRLEVSGVFREKTVWVYGFDTIRNTMCDLLVHAAGIAEKLTVVLVSDAETAPDGRMFAAQRKSIGQLMKQMSEAGIECRCRRTRDRDDLRVHELAFLEKHLFADVQDKVWSEKTDAISLYSAANPSVEAGEAVRTLLEWHEKGIPWGHMAITLPAMEETADALRAALSISDIPCYIERKQPAAGHGLCRMLSGALRAATENYQQEDVLTFVRSGFTVLQEEEALLIEDYAISHGINRKKWTVPFTRGDEAPEAEIIRQKIIGPLEELKTGLKEARTAAESIETVVRFLETQEAYRHLQERENELLKRNMTAEAAANRQVWKQIMELLDQLWTLLGERRAAVRDIAAMIAGGLEQSEVSALPPEEDCVTVGEAGHMLPGKTDALLCMGMQDNIMNVSENGVLTEAERQMLEEQTGRSVGMNADLKVSLRRSDYYRTFALPSKYLKVTWSLGNETGEPMLPAHIAEDLRKMFPECEIGGSITGGNGEEIPYSAAAAMEGLPVRLLGLRNGETDDLDSKWKNALRCLWADESSREKLIRVLKTIQPDEIPESIDGSRALRLFLTKAVSISRLETYAQCPYRHFMRYGLEPVERRNFEFGHDERGSFWHEALDRYMKAGGPEKEAKEADTILDGILNELTEQWKDGPLREDAYGEWEGKDTLRQIRGAARILNLFSRDSDFRTIATEQKFGEEGGLPPVILKPEGTGQVALRGTIDRVDIYDGWVRIIDNKSSKKTLEPGKMEQGEQLQLMLYLKAVLDGMPGTKPAGAMYFPIMDPTVDIPSDDPEKAETERMKNNRFSGVAVNEPDVLKAMDKSKNMLSVGKVLNADGSISKGAKWVVTPETLDGLMDAAVQKAEELCANMRGGDIRIAPLGKEELLPCRYCEYRSVCGSTAQRRREPHEKITFEEVASAEKISYNESK